MHTFFSLPIQTPVFLETGCPEMLLHPQIPTVSLTLLSLNHVERA